MLALSPVSQARGQRVILASRRARENRRVQVAIVVSYAECRSNRCDHRGRDQEKRSAEKSLAAPGDTQTSEQISRLHGEIDASLLAAGAIGFDRLNEAKPLSRSLSLTKRAPYDAACYWRASLSPCDKWQSRLAAPQHRRRSRTLAD